MDVPSLKTPSLKPPIRIEEEYGAALLRMVRFLEQQMRQKVLPMLKTFIDMNLADFPVAPRTDAQRMDARKDIDLLFQNLAGEAEEAFPVAWAESVSGTVANETNTFNVKKNETTFRRILGVKPILSEPWLGPKAESFIADNVDLITSIRSDYHQRMQRFVARAVDRGTLNQDFAGQIERIFGEEIAKVTSNTRARARLIARDQTAKLNSQLNQARQQTMGFTHYRWRTSGDERVRESHAVKNGEIFAWDSPPSDTGHPGEDFQCRCYAEPIITEDFGGDAELAATFNSRR